MLWMSLIYLWMIVGGLWLLARVLIWIFGTGSLPDAEDHYESEIGEQHRRHRTCPRCTALLRPHQGQQCEVCGWPGATEPSQPGERHEAVFQALQGMLCRFRDLGLLRKDEHRSLTTAVRQELNVSDVVLTEIHPATGLPAAELQPELPRATPNPSRPVSPSAGVKSPAETKPPAKAGSPLPSPRSTSPAPVSLRVEQYAERRQQAAREAAAETPPLKRQKRDWGRVFAAFLEKNNIMWGELVGGLMIVVCSIALVISFWAEIAQRPLLKFSIFNGVSAALFAAGFYTHRRWKLHTTSHGVLIIAFLLAPLNFLAIASFTAGSPPSGFLAIAGEGASLALFAALTYYAAQIITPQAPAATALSVMFCSLLQLLVRRFAGPAAPFSLLLGFASAPLVSYALASGFSLHQSLRKERLEASQCSQHFTLLGICAFAALLPVVLLLHLTGHVAATLEQLAPLFVLLGGPALATALLFWQRIESTPAALRVAAASVGSLGGLLCMAAVVLAWPLPGSLLAAALINAVLWIAIAHVARLPRLHMVAAAFLTVAWLVGAAVVAGEAMWTIPAAAALSKSLLSAATGTRLVPLAALLTALAVGTRRFADAATARSWSFSAAAVAAGSLALLLAFAFGRLGDPSGATWYFAFYAGLATFAAASLDHRKLSQAAATLLLITLVQAIVFRWGAGWSDSSDWITSLLSYGSIAAAISAATKLRRGGQATFFGVAFAQASLASSVVAASLLVSLSKSLQYTELAESFSWLALLWLSLAWLLDQAPLFVGFQLALAISVGVSITAEVADEPWFADAPRKWLEPWFLQIQAVALAVSAIFWRLLRIVFSKRLPAKPHSPAIDLQRAPWATFDRTAEVILCSLTIALAAYAALPGMRQELSPPVEVGTRIAVPISDFELPNISSAHAGGQGGWALLAAATALVVIGGWDRRPSQSLLTLYLLGAAGCSLAAAGFTDQTAVASALRWFVGGFTLLAAAPIVARRQIKPALATLGIELDPPPQWLAFSSDSPALSQAGRTVIVALVVGLYLTIAAIVQFSVSRIDDAIPMAEGMFAWSGILALAAAMWWLVLGQSSQQTGAEQSGSPQAGAEQQSHRLTNLSRHLFAIVGTAPLLAVSAYITATKLSQRPLLGPDPASWFAGLGNSLLYGGPLLMFALVLLAFAIRESSSRYAFSFGLLSTVVATLVYLLELAAQKRPLDAAAWIELAQLNAAVLAIVALAWHGAVAWKYRSHLASAPRPRLLLVLAAIAVTFAGETLIAGCWGLVDHPANLTWQTSVARVSGLISLALAAAAMWLTTGASRQSLRRWHVGGLFLFGVSLIACLAVRFDTGRWQAYHTLLIGCAVAGWAWVSLPTLWRSTAGALCFALLTTMLALRELFSFGTPPSWPWWSIGGLLAMYGLLLRIASINARRWPIWLAAPLLGIAGHAWWLNVVPQKGANLFVNFFELNAILLSLAAICSVLVELRWSRLSPDELRQNKRSLGFHRFAVWLAVACLLLAVGEELSAVRSTPGWPRYWALGVIALVTAFAATVATLWDQRIRWPVPVFYCLGLTAVGKYLSTLQLQGETFIWAFTLALAAFVLASSYCWQRRAAIAGFAIRLGAPEHLRERLHSQAWVLSANSVAIAVVIYLVVRILLIHSAFDERMIAAYAVLACALSFALLAAGRVETVLRYVALATGALFAVAFAWAWISPSLPFANLHRLVAAVVALATTIPVYGALFVKIWRRENAWTTAAQQMIPSLVATTGVLLAATLGVEVSYFIDGKTAPLVWPAVLAIALAVAALTLSALAAALLPGRDPLNLSERGRTLYVYAAEALLGLLFLHFRVTMPWLFTGFFARYWPLVVMLLAFLGAGLSEWFSRRKNRVLSEPLGNTSILLPLLPVLNFWVAGEAGQYALLLLAVGSLYTIMSIMRKSPLLMGLALLAANGSLWTMLSSVEGLGLLAHPQLWLIPPVLCVLVGAELSRSRLTSSQLSSFRYACAVMIYAASTADIFINGVGASIWLPIALAALSLAGIFAGIWLRVRAFLFLGLAFLSVALFSVVWHAAVELERTWIWWIAGIVTGVVIIVLFGLFEKKREEALALVETLKQWEA